MSLIPGIPSSAENEMLDALIRVNDPVSEKLTDTEINERVVNALVHTDEYHKIDVECHIGENPSYDLAEVKTALAHQALLEPCLSMIENIGDPASNHGFSVNKISINYSDGSHNTVRGGYYQLNLTHRNPETGASIDVKLQIARNIVSEIPLEEKLNNLHEILSGQNATLVTTAEVNSFSPIVTFSHSSGSEIMIQEQTLNPESFRYGCLTLSSLSDGLHQGEVSSVEVHEQHAELMFRHPSFEASSTFQIDRQENTSATAIREAYNNAYETAYAEAIRDMEIDPEETQAIADNSSFFEGANAPGMTIIDSASLMTPDAIAEEQDRINQEILDTIYVSVDDVEVMTPSTLERGLDFAIADVSEIIIEDDVQSMDDAEAKKEIDEIEKRTASEE